MIKKICIVFLLIALLFTIFACQFSNDSPNSTTETTDAFVSETGRVIPFGAQGFTLPSDKPPTERPIIKEPGINVTKDFTLLCKLVELLHALETHSIQIIPSEYQTDNEAFWNEYGIDYVNDGRMYDLEDGGFSYETADGDWFDFTEDGKLYLCKFFSMRFSSGEGARIGDSFARVFRLYYANEKLPPQDSIFDVKTKDGVYVFCFEDGQLERWYFTVDIEAVYLMGS